MYLGCCYTVTRKDHKHPLSVIVPARVLMITVTIPLAIWIETQCIQLYLKWLDQAIV